MRYYAMTLVVLAAGMGSRYGGLKQIDPIGPNGEFIIDYSCYDAIRAGFDKIVFVIKKENFEIFNETVVSRIPSSVEVKCVFQESSDLPSGHTLPEGRVKPWGTAHAVLAARNEVKGHFATINADDFYGYDTFRVLADHFKSTDPHSKPMPCCMVGFKLGNTLTENGTVSRGICEVGKNGFLKSITERTKIRVAGEDAEYEDNGKWHPLSSNSIASMNCYGLTSDIFEKISGDFSEFLSNMSDPLKNEFYLPTAVTNTLVSGAATLKVYETESKWYGVTYAADKEFVKQSISKMIKEGAYPEKLWS